MTTQNIAGIARAALLTNLTISTYTGRKMDRNTAEEVAAAKNAGSKHAVSTYKSLFADSAELKDIASQAGYIRTLHYRLTLPWDDMGPRLLPTAKLMDYQKQMGDAIQAFDDCVLRFLNRYDTLVSVAAFKLGALFDRDEYPSREALASKFRVSIAFAPLPTSGDFRLDVETEVLDELAERYERMATEKLNEAMNDTWERLHDMLQRLSHNLRTPEEGEKRARLNGDLVSGALDLCTLLSDLNITRDPALERARQALEQAMAGVDVDTLRESEDIKASTKKKVDAILEAYEWSL